MEKIDGQMEDVILIDEAGEQTHFAHILTFLYEGERYIALEPLTEDAEEETADAEEAEVVLLHVQPENGEDTYVPIENEILLDEVFGEFLSLMEEIEAEEE